MSRLIVKNLPKTITSEKLKEIFSEKGVVTDVQLKYTKTGKFRQFGFVGFKTPEEARNALEYFDGSCLGTLRLKVLLCAGLGDPSKPKAWSKYAADSSASIVKEKITTNNEKNKSNKKQKEAEKSEIKEVLEKHKNDPLFMEFMEVHAKNNKALWSDSGLQSSKPQDVKKSPAHSVQSSSEDEENEENEEVKAETAATADISDMEYLKHKMETSVESDNEASSTTDIGKSKKSAKKQKKWVEFYTVKVKGLPYKARKKEIKQFFSPLKPKSIRVPVNAKGFAYAGFKTEKEMKRALIKNMSFLAGKRISVIKLASSEENSENTLEGKESTWKKQEEGLKNEETIAESGRIFVRNLAFTVTEDDLTQHFSKYGPVTEVIMPFDRITRKAKGYALVTYMVPENAATAYTELDGSVFQGRMMHLLPGKAKQSLEELLAKEGLTFKEKQALKKKAEAASSHNWNTLFLGQNAVADIIAETYNTPKEKVLDSSGKESVAVRLALGETQIVSQIKGFLEESGVRLDAFNQPTTQRSKTVILVKNLPAKTADHEIRTLFAKFGELGRVILPPSGVTAIVEFLEPSEARSAFMKLAYTRFKHLPLYLEWAPSNTFTTSAADWKQTKAKVCADFQETVGNNVPGSIPVKEERVPTIPADSPSSDEENDEPEPNSTLFVKNLNFSTTEQAIREHFKNCGSIHSVMIATRKDPNTPGQLLSIGQCFIQFKRQASVEKALKTLQHSVLDDFSVELKRSNRTLQSDVVSARKISQVKKQTGSKILVRNIPFQANKKEVVDLFKTFGELKAVRLPLKMAGTGSHRGFAFVEYLTKNDAKRAFQALCQSTHLYGRRLALEWAANDEDVEEIRKRTAQNFLDVPKIKNLRKSTVDPEMEGVHQM
ncbi:probable RNA-binding protein 19 [Bacillus rossius redtenbacheri]|uniref:probable RNA-binding protein 19 n=1 Tax=Bacillus rossius redtenbacheri TaxID=93214 RepID=UPI002FDDE9D3